MHGDPCRLNLRVDAWLVFSELAIEGRCSTSKVRYNQMCSTIDTLLIVRLDVGALDGEEPCRERVN